jgi:hypothetical protein
MHFPHIGSIVTIDQLACHNHHPNFPLVQAAPLYVPSVHVGSTPPSINYVVYYPRCLIAYEKEHVQSCFPSPDMVSKIDLEFSFEFYLAGCISSIPCACYSSLIDSAGPGQNLHRHMKYGELASPFVIVDPPCSRNFLDFELPLDEAILEAMTMYCIPCEDLHHGLCFLPFWETFQVDY